MTDPYWMLLMLHALPRDYIVWDKAGAIEFVKPGRSTVHAEFHPFSYTHLDVYKRQRLHTPCSA